MILFKKHKPVTEIWAGKHICPKCKTESNFHFVNMKLTVSYLFIPVASRNEKRYLICDSCGHSEELSSKQFKENCDEMYSRLKHGQFPDEIIKADFNPDTLKIGGQMFKLILSGAISLFFFICLFAALLTSEDSSGLLFSGLFTLLILSIPFIYSLKNFLPLWKKRSAYKELTKTV